MIGITVGKWVWESPKAMSNLKQHGRLRWVPSYLRRQGQMTPGQKRAFRDLWNTFGIGYRFGQRIQIDDHFPDGGGRHFLEIGFGMGENLVHQARRHPDARILGIEVHKPGLGAALKKIGEAKVKNVRIMRGDARLILSDFLEEETRFERVSLLFPDPWPEPGNRHRRIVQSDFIDLLETRMKTGGRWHVATDVAEYGEHCRDLMSKRIEWRKEEIAEMADFRGATRYEARGIARGHPVVDLLYRFGTATGASPEGK